MAKSTFTCRGLFAYPVKPQRYTTEPVRPLDGINKDVSGPNYCMLMTASVYPVDCACFCPLLTQHHCRCSNGRCNPPSASHPLYTPLVILVAVKEVAQNPANIDSYKTLAK